MPERPLRVAVDARCLNVANLRGHGKSTYELIRRTSASGAIDWHLFSNRPDLPLHVPNESLSVSVFRTPGAHLRAWEQYSLPAAASRMGADLLHTPQLTSPWWQPVPTVVSVPDTHPWQSDNNDAWPSGFYRDRLLPSSYHRAAALITLSNTSRRDILARWPALKPKLHVVPRGVDDGYLDAEPDGAPIVVNGQVIAEPYLLYVGGADPGRRLMWALQAWWTGRASHATMVACGVDAGVHRQVRASVPRHVKDRLILAPHIDGHDMPRLYMRATAVLYPSVSAGFGLPVVEAHAVGTRVLFSDVGCLTDLKGPTAVVLPVDDLPAWSRTLDLLLQSRSSSYGPDRIARAWARQYSWDAHIDRVLRIYASVAAQRVHGDHEQHVSQGATS